jgi:pimeloyl-ACP methyl ester carboxylesterase
MWAAPRASRLGAPLSLWSFACWKKVTPLLRARAHDVFTPTLTGLGERAHLASPEVGLETHIQDVVNVLKYEDLNGAILVANSSGGMVITGVADRCPIRSRIWFIWTPSYRRMARACWTSSRRTGGPSWKPLYGRRMRAGCCHASRRRRGRNSCPRLGASPMSRTCVGPYPASARRHSGISRIPCDSRMRPPPSCRARIFAVRWPNASFDRYADIARKTAGWRCRELATSHLPYVTHPRELVDLLLEVAGKR